MPSNEVLADLPETQTEPMVAVDASDALYAVVFAGGIGSRFWPLSSPTRPKQLLPLVDDRPLIADTLRRFRSLIPPERVLVMTSRDIASAIHAAIPEVPAANMLAEPAPMGTAASLAWGVAEVKRRAGANALVCVTHADLAIFFQELFHDALVKATAAARSTDSMILLGVTPTRPDPSFGYIAPASGARFGPRRMDTPVSFVERPLPSGRFVEKPDVSECELLIAGGSLWFSGIFVARAGNIEKQLRDNTPEVAALLGVTSTDVVAGLRDRVTSISVEHGLFQRCNSLQVLPVDFGWDDVGTWASLRRARDLDDDGNGIIGAAHLVDASANVVHTETGATVLYGVDNLLVVRLNGLTFVTSLERARDLRPLLESLPPELRRRAPE